jgi:hypothetical protein
LLRLCWRKHRTRVRWYISPVNIFTSIWLFNNNLFPASNGQYPMWPRWFLVKKIPISSEISFISMYYLTMNVFDAILTW